MLRKSVGGFLEKLIISDTRYVIRKIFEKLYRKDNRVLDLGCGNNGSFNYNNLEKSINLSGYDLDEGSVLNFSKKYNKLIEGFGVENILDLKDLGKFDFVLSGGVIQYLDKPDEFLIKLKGLMSNKGFLIISTVNKNSLLRRLKILSKSPKKNAGEHKIYSIEEMKRVLEENGFKINLIKGADFFPIPKNLSSNIIFLCELNL